MDKITRADALKGLIVLPALAGALVATSGEAQAKSSQQSVKYQNKPKGSQKCSGCRFFQKPSGCQVVAGKISPNGWCDIWTKK